MPDLDIKGVLESLHAGIQTFNSRFDKLQSQVDAIDARGQFPGFSGARGGGADLAQTLWDASEFAELRSRGGRGHIHIQLDKSFSAFEAKTVITAAAAGSSTSGVMPIQRFGGIVPEARRQLRIRDLMTTYPATTGLIDFVKVNAFSKVVSPQTEAADKGESEMTFTTAQETVQTIATTIPASRQVLEDLAGLRAFIEGSLRFAVEEEIEDQIVSGAGTGLNLNGLTTQAQAFDTNLLSATDGWEFPDIIARSAQQIASDNETPSNFTVLNPQDWWTVRLLKDTTGNYIFGNPSQPAPVNIFGLIAVPTTAMAQGYFLTGSTAPEAAALFERGPLMVEISTEHSDFFAKNKVMFRAEQRMTLTVFRPNAFCYGALNTSPV